MKVIQIALLLVVLMFSGCKALDRKDYSFVTEKGWVRSIWSSCYGTSCVYNVIFEEESGRIVTYKFRKLPPIWKRIHCRLKIWESGKYMQGQYVIVTDIIRLGEDAK